MTLHKNRRNFMKSAACAGSLTTFSGCTAAMKRDKSSEAYPDKLPEPLPKGLEYVLKVRDMVESLKEDHEKFDRAADICVEAIVSGKKVYYSLYGHNEAQGILETKPGRPSFLIPYTGREQIEKGDVFFSQSTPQCIEVIEQGARVIGIIYAFTPKKFQGQGIGFLLMSDAIIRAQEKGCTEVIVGTAPSAGIQLALYHKAGFTEYAIRPDFYIRNYPEPIIEDGIQLRDMVLLKKQL